MSLLENIFQSFFPPSHQKCTLPEKMFIPSLFAMKVVQFLESLEWACDLLPTKSLLQTLQSSNNPKSQAHVKVALGQFIVLSVDIYRDFVQWGVELGVGEIIYKLYSLRLDKLQRKHSSPNASS